MGSKLKMNTVKFLRRMLICFVSSLQMIKALWQTQKRTKVKGNPRIIGNGLTAFNAASGVLPSAAQSNAMAAAPSVTHQNTFCGIGGSSTPLAASISTTKDAESEEVMKYKKMQTKVVTVIKDVQPGPP